MKFCILYVMHGNKIYSLSFIIVIVIVIVFQKKGFQMPRPFKCEKII